MFHIEIEAPQQQAGLFDFGVKEVTMIGMSFISFMELLGISAVVALVLHYLLKYRNIAGFDGFLGKVIIGSLGAWLGSPVFGHWPANWSVADVYPIPALLGSLSSVFGVVLVSRRSPLGDCQCVARWRRQKRSADTEQKWHNLTSKMPPVRCWTIVSPKLGLLVVDRVAGSIGNARRSDTPLP
jgi:uncharacterized membrane protein YeaQ/YmgE (transglycosylase-associated protein family)